MSTSSNENHVDLDYVESTSGKRRRSNTLSVTVSEATKSVKMVKRGRIAKGMDWWSVVDNWFKSKSADWGDALDSPAWKLCVQLIFICDMLPFILF